MIDYLSCILFKAAGFLIGRLPLSLSFFLGARLGDVLCFLDAKHSAIVYSNIKTAFGNNASARQMSNLLKEFYRSFGQTLIEFFIFPKVEKNYLKKYITFEGLDNIALGFDRGKGVILAVIHEGSWEISNIISANLGYPFNIVVREQQKFLGLNRLLNIYRSQKGSKLIETKNQTRKIIEALKKNEAVAMTVDQGGKSGTLVKFFGKDASMSTGAVRLSLKFGATIIPVFSTRMKDQRIKFIIEEPFEIKETGDTEKDVRDNLQRLISIFEKHVKAYPKEYLWTYKVWKYSSQRNILILSDSKAGHLRQAQAAANIIAGYLKDRNISVDIKTAQVMFRNMFSRTGIALCALFTGRYQSRLRVKGLKVFLKESTYAFLEKFKPDIVVSCGSSLSALNCIISSVNQAKSVVIMRPSILSAGRFDLAVMSSHDNPPKSKNIAVIEGALNLISEGYLKSHSESLSGKIKVTKKFILGLLIGGDTKNFRFGEDSMNEALSQLKSSLDKFDGEILVTTSRRTSERLEALLKDELSNYPRCKLLVIANRNNMPEAVGGILGLANIVITSPESISMISEAVSAGKYVLVLKLPGVSAKHERFLELFSKKNYIYLVEPRDLNSVIGDILKNMPKLPVLRDGLLVEEALKRIL